MDDHGHDHDHGSDAVTIAVIVAGLLFMAYEGVDYSCAVHRLARVYRNSNLLYCLYSSCIPSIAYRRSQYLKRPSVRRELLNVYRYIEAIAIDALPEAVGVILFYRIGEFFEEKLQIVVVQKS